MSPVEKIAVAVEGIAAAKSWNKRISLIREIPEEFGKAQHQLIYAEIANAVYVSDMVPDFAYIHWRDDYDLPTIELAYKVAYEQTQGFLNVDANTLARIIETQPSTLRIFRLFLGFTTQEFAASSLITAGLIGTSALSNSTLKSMESGKISRTKSKREAAASAAAAVIDQTSRP